MMVRHAVSLVVCGFLLVFYSASYKALLLQRSNTGLVKHVSSGIWNLPSPVLLALAGEFKGLMSDYLTLEVGAQLGTEVKRSPDGSFRAVDKEQDWASIYRIFVASQTLDPSFAQTFIVAQGWLPWEANMVEETQGILQTAADNRPWDWQPLHYMGFNNYFFFNQFGEAGKLFLGAAQTPNAPSFLSILGARLAQKGGETEGSIALMKSILVDKSENEPGYDDIVDRLHALEGVYAIEQGVKKYEKTYGRKPLSLEELTSSGILSSLPENPYNMPYCVDSQGAVHFDNPNCR